MPVSHHLLDLHSTLAINKHTAIPLLRTRLNIHARIAREEVHGLESDDDFLARHNGPVFHTRVVC